MREPAGESMNRDNAGTNSMRIMGWGHAIFAATMLALGILGLVKGAFAPVWLPVPKALPAGEIFVYLTAIVSLLSGIGLILRRTAAIASGALLGLLLVWLLLLDAPQFVLNPGMQLTWAAAKTATLVAASWVLYVWFAWDNADHTAGQLARNQHGRLAFAAGSTALRVARALYGLALIVFGIAHFTYLGRTAAMVPGWLPWHLFWAYFFGCAFIAAGLALLASVYARLAATLSVVQLAMFTVLVWVPVVAAGPSPSDWIEFVVSWTLTAAAWVVADSYRDMPWLAVGGQWGEAPWKE